MRSRLTSVAMVCGLVLAAGSALAQDAKKKEEPQGQSKPAPAAKSAKEKAAEEKAAAEKAAAEKAAAEKAGEPLKDGETPKAAVNTLEDFFAAYGMTAWTSRRLDIAAAQEEAVVWKDSTAARPVIPAPAADATPRKPAGS